MDKFVKVMYGTTSGANKEFEYKIGEVNIANNWNLTANSGKEFGGFNFATEDKILRWLHRGDTIYDVEVPKDAEIVKIEGATTIYRADKIIISNPRPITDEIALEFYKKSNIPEVAYFIQQSIKHNVETMSKFKIVKVDVHVDSVEFNDEAAK